MKSLLKVTLALLVGITLSGCSIFTKEIIVYQTEYVLRTPPAALMEDCSISAPPAVNDYMVASTQKKEELLVKFSAKQTRNLQMCNQDKKSLREWTDKQTDLFDKEKGKDGNGQKGK